MNIRTASAIPIIWEMPRLRILALDKTSGPPIKGGPLVYKFLLACRGLLFYKIKDPKGIGTTVAGHSAASACNQYLGKRLEALYLRDNLINHGGI